ncbi:MAG: PAS domain S-box protein [Nitrospiraceae bacterium]|nr:MAG: PAS domain S-box protein [Nitrospiraceae bacterium]
MNEISCRVVKTFLDYVKNTRPEFLPSLLEGIPHDHDYLSNPDHWISWDVERLLEERLADLYKDEMIMFKIGRSILTYKSVGIVNILFNLFMTPERLIRYTPRIAQYFTRDVVTINVIETTRESATIELKIKGRQTRGACLYNQGMYSVFTELFGLEPAEVSEVQCVVPLNEIGRYNGRYYRIEEDMRVLESDRPDRNGRIAGTAEKPGAFRINGITFGAPSCIYRLKWENKIIKLVRKSAGKKQALNDALQHLEDNHRKLQGAYERLWKSEANYRNLMENASDIICFVDSAGIITSLNRKGLELSGYTTDEMVGQHFLGFVDEEYRREAFLRFRRAFRPSSDPFEMVVRTKDSGLLILSVNSNPVQEGRDAVGLMIIARDITKEREIGVRLIEAERFAAKGMVAAEIAHEINNSLANIETALFIVNSLKTDAKYKQDIFKDMYEEIERMSGIVKGILEVYRSDDAILQSVDLNTETKKVINMTRRRLDGKAISIVSSLTPDLQSIPCNPGHIKQVLLNLIKNAEEAMASSSRKLIEINTSQDNGTVRLAVKDTGCGIPEPMREKVFSPLYTSKAEGSGFGLSVCRQIVRKYSGTISIESEVDKGTTVVVSFPVKDHAEHTDS